MPKLSFNISKREIEIIRLTAQQLNNMEIAQTLNISVRTVESHKLNLIKKTKTKRFVGVIIFALSNKLLRLDEMI